MPQTFGIQNRLKHFFTSLLVIVVMPLLPLGIEKMITGSIGISSLTISAAMFAITIGICSNDFLFLVGLILGIVCSVLYGAQLHAPSAELPYGSAMSYTSISIVGAGQLVERWGVHVKRGRKFRFGAS